jgi:hypothetical protein
MFFMPLATKAFLSGLVSHKEFLTVKRVKKAPDRIARGFLDKSYFMYLKLRKAHCF